MQSPKLLGMFLMTCSCLALGTVASAEPVSNTTAAKKHAGCQRSKAKTACNKQADVTDLVKSRQAPSTTAPTAGGQPTAVAKSQEGLQPAKEDGAEAQRPK